MTQALNDLNETKSSHFCDFKVGALGIGAVNETELEKFTPNVTIIDHHDKINNTKNSTEDFIKDRYKKRRTKPATSEKYYLIVYI